MPKIIQLDRHVADLIAAGEVVERPASAVKELVENSIDAGAKNITIELQNGGMTFLRITDDGCGMAPDDARTAFLRHATSKLHDEQGLEAIGTMGFRGEALAAISAVSHITLTTRQRGAASGTHMTLDAGDVRASLAALLPGWTAAIVGCMLLYYLCDALKYRLITRAFGCAQPLGDSIDVSMIGFFYSAVTPAAAGGQPFQVLHMHRRGIPTGTATSVICTVYSLWNIALVTLGIVGACLCGGKLAAQSAAWIPVLALGLFVHAGLLSLVLLSAIFPKPMSAFGTACIRWLYRRKLFVRRGADPEAAAEKWCAFVAEYHDAFAAGIRHRGKLAGALALALGQCAAYMSVAYCTYRGFGLRGVPFWQVTGTQVLLYIGASCFPMPGASGASEGTFYLAFSPLFGDYLTTAMLIWRLASYYLTIVLGYIAVVAERVTLRRAET